ncbi:Ppx/GppA family phosphatase [Formicincola oecophyllae]
MVVFEGVSRNPVPIFNEKATLQLGKGMQATGKLGEGGVEKALDVLARFGAIASAMGVGPFVVMATAAVRDATNGPAFVAQARQKLPKAHFRILRGDEEADYSAAGVLCAVPGAVGVAADIGGGSMELIKIEDGAYSHAMTTHLGVIRLSEAAEGSVEKATIIASAILAAQPWLREGAGKPLYLVGGAFRALARAEIARTRYPLNMVHLFTLSPRQALDLTAWCQSKSVKELEKTKGVPRKRAAQLPFAAVVLEQLLKQVRPSEVVFSADGLREGWYMRDVVPSTVRAENPMDALAQEMAQRLGRNAALAPALVRWTAPLFSPDETEPQKRWRALACAFSDIGSYDHPQYRAAQAYQRILVSHGVGFQHPARAFLALAVAVRYEMDPDDPTLKPSRKILSKADFTRAVLLGQALRLAYTLCAGTEELLARYPLKVEGPTLSLDLKADGMRMEASVVKRRLAKLAASAGLEGVIKGEGMA